MMMWQSVAVTRVDDLRRVRRRDIFGTSGRLNMIKAIFDLVLKNQTCLSDFLLGGLMVLVTILTMFVELLT